MNYKDHLDLFGTPVKLIPSITGKGAPTTATVGAVGCLYMDTNNGNLYKRTNTGWKAVAEGTGGGGGGGGAEVLNVWVEGNEADHTSGEIFDHVSNVRGPVQLQYNDVYYQLLRADDSVAWFGYINDEGHATVVCVNGNEIEEYHFDYVPASHFDEVIGDISTALDHIIEIQEELIGT